MGMTTVVLIILAISIRAMSWADSIVRRREAARASVETVSPEASEETDSHPAEESKDGRARAAAIAVALALSQGARNGTASNEISPAETSSATPVYDSWLAEGRARQRAKHGTAMRARDRR